MIGIARARFDDEEKSFDANLLSSDALLRIALKTAES
jgi:hypothetical protein